MAWAASPMHSSPAGASAAAVDGHGQQLHVVPITQLADAVAQHGLDFHDALAQRVEAARLEVVEAALGDHVGALPVVAAIEHHQDVTGLEPAQHRALIAGIARQPHPQHVDRRAEVVDDQSGERADVGVAAVGPDDEPRAHLERTVRRRRSHAGDRAGRPR
jgi:hypothetical protein